MQATPPIVETFGVARQGRQTRGRIKQPIVHGVSKAESARADIANFGVQRGLAANSAETAAGERPTDCGNDGRRSSDIGPVDIGFYAHDDMARLIWPPNVPPNIPPEKGTLN